MGRMEHVTKVAVLLAAGMMLGAAGYRFWLDVPQDKPVQDSWKMGEWPGTPGTITTARDYVLATDAMLDKCVHTMNLMIDRINAEHPEVRIPHVEEDHDKQRVEDRK